MFMRNPVPVLQELAGLLGFLPYHRQRPRETSFVQDYKIWFPVPRSDTSGWGFCHQKKNWPSRQLQSSASAVSPEARSRLLEKRRKGGVDYNKPDWDPSSWSLKKTLDFGWGSCIPVHGSSLSNSYIPICMAPVSWWAAHQQ